MRAQAIISGAMIGGLPRFLFPLFSEAASIIHPLPLDESGLTERLGEAPGGAGEREIREWRLREAGFLGNTVA